MGNEIVIKEKKRFVEYLPSWLKNINSMFYYFLFLVLLGVVFFATSLFINYFTTPFTGDYSSQQFAFYTNGYDDWWHFFKTGEFVLYDTNTFLGVDNIGSNSFYYLFDPFFMPILLVPRQLVPQGMAVLTIFKIAASGMVFFLYMRYLGASRTASKITGIAYAFSGWMTWYLWFNHFTEIAIVLPLILLGIEMTLKEKKPWVLAGAICMMGFTNYFFCICFVMCAFLYAMFRYFQRIKLNNWKDNLIILGLGFAGFAVGLIMPAMVVFPSAMHALTSPRASSSYFDLLKESFKAHNLKKIFELLTSWTAMSSRDQDKARALYPFIDFIYPVTSCRGTPLTVLGSETYDNVAGSSYCFIPMMMLLGPAFFDSLKKKHFSVLVPLVFFVFALFTPCFYYLFHGFTQAYSRWTLFVTTSILAYTGLYLDKLREKSFIPLVAGGCSMIVMALVGGMCAIIITQKYPNSFTERVPIWLAMLLECLYIVIVTVVLCIIKTKPKLKFYAFFAGFISVEVALMGAFVIQGHGVEDYYYTNKGFIKNDVLHSLVEKTRKQDNSYYRSFSSLASSSASNDEMRNNYNGANFFHSIFNYNTADIDNWAAIANGTSPGSWSGTYIQKRPYMDTLLGIKYYYIEDDYYRYQHRSDASSEDFRYNAPLNYLDVTDQYPNSEFRVYKNMDYIDFALTYDSVFETYGNPLEEDSYEGLYETSSERSVLGLEEAYLKHAIINSYREKAVLDDIKENHPDITVEPASINPLSYYYKVMTIERYASTTSPYYDSMLTYYDMHSAGKKALDLSAKDYLTLCNRDNNTFEKTQYPEIAVEDSESRRWVAVIEANGECFPSYDVNGNIFYVNARFSTGYDFDIYLVDTNNEIVTYDNHNDGFYNSARVGKEMRTFYITPQYGVDESGNLTIEKVAPKIKKIIIVSRGLKMQSTFSVYIDTALKHNVKMTKAKEYVLTDVQSSGQVFKFKTNFDKERVVVTRLAYEDGFRIKMVDQNGQKHDVNVFNGQGGFASFISGTGNCSYTMDFYTPYLSISSYFSMIGTFVYLSSFAAYLYYEMRRQDKETLYLFKH